MAMDFTSKSIYAKAEISTIYFRGFEYIISRRFGHAYRIISESPERMNRICPLKQIFTQDMKVFLDDTEDDPIDPRIRKLVEACHKKALSFDWTDRGKADKFYRQMNRAKGLGKNRLEKLEDVMLASEVACQPSP